MLRALLMRGKSWKPSTLFNRIDGVFVHEIVVVILLFNACAKDHARKTIAGRQNVYKAMEVMGMLAIDAGILCENLLTGVNGAYFCLPR